MTSSWMLESTSYQSPLTDKLLLLQVFQLWQEDIFEESGCQKHIVVAVVVVEIVWQHNVLCTKPETVTQFNPRLLCSSSPPPPHSQLCVSLLRIIDDK